MTKAKSITSKHSSAQAAQLPTFMEHVRELQIRLFWVALFFIAISSAAYPFFSQIADIILAPLSKNQQLVYLTPGGAFSFIIQVCLYIGVIGTIPVIIFHVYRFVMPAVQRVHLRRVLLYTVSSLILAIIGIVFAYFVSLPAALYFLTSFNLYHINPMLTVDSYFSFVMTYLLLGALLFQIPVVMSLINTIKPLTPKKLMKAERYVIVGAFIVAGVLSPTPDALNQTLLAAPMILMYQLGVTMVWLKNRSRAKARRLAEEAQVHREVAPAPVATLPGPGPGAGPHTSAGAGGSTGVKHPGIPRPKPALIGGAVQPQGQHLRPALSLGDGVKPATAVKTAAAASKPANAPRTFTHPVAPRPTARPIDASYRTATHSHPHTRYETALGTLPMVVNATTALPLKQIQHSRPVQRPQAPSRSLDVFRPVSAPAPVNAASIATPPMAASAPMATPQRSQPLDSYLATETPIATPARSLFTPSIGTSIEGIVGVRRA